MIHLIIKYSCVPLNLLTLFLLNASCIIIDEQNITPVPLLDEASSRKNDYHGSKSVNGSIELAIWHKDDKMTVHICQCKDLLGMSLFTHNYVQVFLSADESSQTHVFANNYSRKLTKIVSGKENPEFDAKITVS